MLEKTPENISIDEAIRISEAEYNADGILLDAKDELIKLRQKYSMEGVTFHYPPSKITKSHGLFFDRDFLFVSLISLLSCCHVLTHCNLLIVLWMAAE